MRKVQTKYMDSEAPEGHQSMEIVWDNADTYTVVVCGKCECGAVHIGESGTSSNARRLVAIRWRQHYAEAPVSV
jgi:carbonic anhydrase